MLQDPQASEQRKQRFTYHISVLSISLTRSSYGEVGSSGKIRKPIIENLVLMLYASDEKGSHCFDRFGVFRFRCFLHIFPNKSRF